MCFKGLFLYPSLKSWFLGIFPLKKNVIFINRGKTLKSIFQLRSIKWIRGFKSLFLDSVLFLFSET